MISVEVILCDAIDELTTVDADIHNPQSMRHISTKFSNLVNN